MDDIKDNTKPPTPSSDDLTQSADALSQKLDNAAGGIGDLGDNLGQALENGINTAEQKLDDFISGMDKFLGKF